jgi:internalin A
VTPKEKAYAAEARRRIQEAKETGALALDLSGFALTRLPPELISLTSLQRLDLFACKQLSGDLSPLSRLTSLQTLNLSGCEQLSGDLSPLSRLTSLRSLDLSRCHKLSGDLSPLAHLTSLQSLNLSGCVQLSGDLAPLAHLTSLQTLDLASCFDLSGDLAPLAGLTSLQSLTLNACYQLSGDLAPLASLTSLQSLILHGCTQFSDLAPLASLTSLRSLILSGCTQFSDLAPLASLTSLRSLNLSWCVGIRRFSLLESLLPTLHELYLLNCKFEDLPSEICGNWNWNENVLNKVRAHYEDLKSGQQTDTALKVLFLGNGGVGKTQLCRRLRNLAFDPSIPTTHGVQLGETTVDLDGFAEPVPLNLWDFGGQDIYHGSHALFLHEHAIFLILWTPELDRQTAYQEGSFSLHNRPLPYWVDYLRAFAGTDASMLIVQSQCDSVRDRTPHPPAKVDDFPFLRSLAVSAKTGLGLNLVKAELEEAVRNRFDRRPPPPIGAGRLKVRDRLRQMLEEDQKREPARRQHRLLEREEFDRLCDEVGGVSDKGALLDFLHHNGVVFYRQGLFGDRIILDQNWALEAIYAIFDRKKTLPMLRGYGRFNRADLERLIWWDHTPEEQNIFLGMMESCGICFKVRKLPDNEWEYIAPDLLPEWSDAQELLLGRLRYDPPEAEATASYAFLHEGILRGYLSELGESAKDAPIYWKYGCWFYEQKTRSQVLIEGRWNDAASESGAGSIRIRAWGVRADELMESLLRALQRLPVGQPPEIQRTKTLGAHAGSLSSASAIIRLVPEDLGLTNLEIPSRPELPLNGTPEIFISYAWGDDSSETARKRADVVDSLCATLANEGWNIIRDKNAMRSGDLISGFMKRIGFADHVIVVLSDKYLRSPYCMAELYGIYQRSVGEKEDFLRRIVPLALDDARFGNWRDRLVYTKHWRAEFEGMELNFKDLGEADFRLYKSMQEWHNRIGDMLAYLNDVLAPHGFDDIVRDDFAALRQMLQRRC